MFNRPCRTFQYSLQIVGENSHTTAYPSACFPKLELAVNFVNEFL